MLKEWRTTLREESKLKLDSEIAASVAIFFGLSSADFLWVVINGF